MSAQVGPMTPLFDNLSFPIGIHRSFIGPWSEALKFNIFFCQFSICPPQYYLKFTWNTDFVLEPKTYFFHPIFARQTQVGFLEYLEKLLLCGSPPSPHSITKIYTILSTLAHPKLEKENQAQNSAVRIGRKHLLSLIHILLVIRSKK